MKKLVTFFLIGFFSLSLASAAFAECGGGKCPMKMKGHGSSCKGGGEYKCPIVAKIMKKAHFFLENQKEIGLSEDQVQAIKAIKAETKKAYIRQEAEMKIFQMELEEKMHEPKVDVEGMNAMIDSASTGFSTSAKASVASYAKLKAVLKDDQWAKVKELWTKHEAAEHHRG